MVAPRSETPRGANSAQSFCFLGVSTLKRRGSLTARPRHPIVGLNVYPHMSRGERFASQQACRRRSGGYQPDLSLPSRFLCSLSKRGTSPAVSACSVLHAAHSILLPIRSLETATCTAALQFGHSNLTASRLPLPLELRGSLRVFSSIRLGVVLLDRAPSNPSLASRSRWRQASRTEGTYTTRHATAS